VVTRALAAVTMREYNINGKEVANDPNQGTH
jgi:hypothetical protein